jgi:DNA invertase Pin-like site-specific DNA recombinase
VLIGYCRISQHEKHVDLDRQQRVLRDAGCSKLFVSDGGLKGRNATRDAAMAFAREEDTIVVATPDRLIRSVRQMVLLIDRLAKRGINLLVLSVGGLRLDTRDKASPLMAAMRGVSVWDKAIRAELQREGVVRAKAEGKYKGRVRTIRPELIRIEAD